jgi:hypothetical protein
MSDFERIRNFIIYKQYATDKEIEKLGCFPYVVIFILLFIALLIYKC